MGRGREIGIFAFAVLEKVVQTVIVTTFENDTVFFQFEFQSKSCRYAVIKFCL